MASQTESSERDLDSSRPIGTPARAEDAAARVVRVAARALRAPAAALAIHVDGEYRLTASIGLDVTAPATSGEVLSLLQRDEVQRGEPLVVNDRSAVGALSGSPTGFAAAIAVPIAATVGSPPAVLCVLERSERKWTDDEVALLSDLGGLLHGGDSGAIRERDGSPAPPQVRFRSLVENAADLVAILTGGASIVYVTPSVRRILGYEPSEVVGQNAFALTHAEDAPHVMEALARVLRGAECDEPIECRLRHRDGSWRMVEIRTSNLLDDPTVEGIVVNARDITDVRDAMQRQRRLNAFLEATPDFVAIFDPHGRALTVNGAFRRAVGLEPDDDLSAVTVTDLFSRAVTDTLMNEGIPTAVRTGLWAGETWLQRVDGTDIPISQVILAHGAPGGGVEFISTLGRDISEQKAAEAALRRSEEHFRSLIENALDIITVVDADGGIVFESPSVRRVLGFEPAELVGEPYLGLIHPEDEPLAREAIQAAITSGTLVGHPFEARFRHREGDWRLLESVCENLLDDPAVAGVVVNSRDITERREAEEELHESREQLLQAQKMEAVGRLAGGVAHDFNNLLTAIKGFTELLLLDLDRRDPRYPFAYEIQAAANRAASLTRQLLAFSRKQVLQPRVFDLNASVADMEKMLRRLIGEDVELVTRRDPRLARIRADPGQVEQIILNLVVNARDAMPAGGRIDVITENETLTVEQAQRQGEIAAGEYAVLAVRDSGGGMSREVQRRIFEPFFTTKEQGRGTGLGLSTVYGIVQQSGGFVTVESAPGEGAEFRVHLPAVEDEGAPTEASPARLPTEGTETVLLVEDENAVRVLVRRVLDRMGYTVLEAEDGPGALRVMEQRGAPVDLLLTDVIMPGMSGRQLADRLLEAQPDLKVLFMSGYTDEAISQHGVLAEGVSFLEKPFTPDLLLQRVREVLGPKRDL